MSIWPWDTTAQHAFIKSVHGVRYQVKDVARSVSFYTEQLGFTLEHQQLPAFAGRDETHKGTAEHGHAVQIANKTERCHQSLLRVVIK
jgi:catechol 2,3-dioxygenase-like lactoylglutathione lyase family enzyme